MKEKDGVRYVNANTLKLDNGRKRNVLQTTPATAAWSGFDGIQSDGRRVGGRSTR